MIKTKDLEKFAEGLGDEIVDIGCHLTWLSARYYKSQFSDFRSSSVRFIVTARNMIRIEENYSQLQEDIFDDGGEMRDIFKPYFEYCWQLLITGTNLAKLIRDFCYKEQQWRKNKEKPDAKEEFKWTIV